MGYGEIPKSCTIENRQNLIEHQLYATIQRKQPPVPPFATDANSARKGFDTVDRVKRLNNGEQQQHMNPDLCPYANAATLRNSFKAPQNTGAAAAATRCATLGRMKNLEMTEYQRQKFMNATMVINTS